MTDRRDIRFDCIDPGDRRGVRGPGVRRRDHLRRRAGSRRRSSQLHPAGSGAASRAAADPLRWGQPLRPTRPGIGGAPLAVTRLAGGARPLPLKGSHRATKYSPRRRGTAGATMVKRGRAGWPAVRKEGILDIQIGDIVTRDNTDRYRVVGIPGYSDRRDDLARFRVHPGALLRLVRCRRRRADAAR